MKDLKLKKNFLQKSLQREKISKYQVWQRINIYLMQYPPTIQWESNCDSLNENAPHSLVDFNTCSPGSGTIWKDYEGRPSWKKCVTGGYALRFEKFHSMPRASLPATWESGCRLLSYSSNRKNHVCLCATVLSTPWWQWTKWQKQ